MGPTETEIQHALKLLREVEHWEGRMAVIPIDPLCLWDDGSGACGEHLEFVSILLQKEKDGGYGADAVAFCKRHTECLQAGLERRRTMA